MSDVLAGTRHDSGKGIKRTGGEVGGILVKSMRNELRLVREYRWNADRFIIFQKIIMQCARHLSGAQVIRRRTRKGLDVWEAGQNQMLVKGMPLMREKYLSASCRDKSEEHRAWTFHRLVLRGDIWTAVCWMSDREKGFMMQPRETCTKTYKPVLDVIWAKHPRPDIPQIAVSTPTLSNIQSW